MSAKGRVPSKEEIKERRAKAAANLQVLPPGMPSILRTEPRPGTYHHKGTAFGLLALNHPQGLHDTLSKLPFKTWSLCEII